MRDELQNSILENDKLPITASTSQQSSLNDKGIIIIIIYSFMNLSR